MQTVVTNIRMRRLIGCLCAALMVMWLSSAAVFGQATERAAPVTGPGVTTIGGIAPNARINVRSGPALAFPAVGALSYGTRVRKGPCIGGGSARWCKVDTLDGRVSGYVGARYLVEGSATTPDDNLAGGPDFWVVRGLQPNERLGVRLQPASGAPALATLRNGEIVRNLGCRMTSGVRWCRIRSTMGMDVTGWVLGRFLRESGAPPVRPPPGGNPGAGASGPDFYVVAGLPAGDTLNVRSQPSTQGAVIARLSPGARVRNLGCQQSGSSRWCRIRTTGGVEVTGWVSGRYLRE